MGTTVRLPWILSTVIITLYLIFATVKADKVGSSDEQKNVIITPKIYSHIFARRREEHKLFLKRLLVKNYEDEYKILKIAFEKFLQLIKELNNTLTEAGYSPKSGFPTNEELQTQLALLLENTCLAGDMILHLPDISYRILKSFPDWRDTFNWAINYVNEFPDLIDKETGKMLDIFHLEINESERPADYVNPYLEVTVNGVETVRKVKTTTKKPKKRLKKGPRLVGRNEL